VDAGIPGAGPSVSVDAASTGPAVVSHPPGTSAKVEDDAAEGTVADETDAPDATVVDPAVRVAPSSQAGIRTTSANVAIGRAPPVTATH
jgi:hypothetical protein